MTAAAFFSPSRSRAASPGRGGPCVRSCRYGRLHRSTTYPRPVKSSATATSSGACALDPAPCANTRPSPFAEADWCRNPRTTGSTFVSANCSQECWAAIRHLAYNGRRPVPAKIETSAKAFARSAHRKREASAKHAARSVCLSCRATDRAPDRRGLRLLLARRESRTYYPRLAELPHSFGRAESRAEGHSHPLFIALADFSHPLDHRDHGLGTAEPICRRAAERPVQALAPRAPVLRRGPEHPRRRRGLVRTTTGRRWSNRASIAREKRCRNHLRPPACGDHTLVRP